MKQNLLLPDAHARISKVTLNAVTRSRLAGFALLAPRRSGGDLDDR